MLLLQNLRAEVQLVACLCERAFRSRFILREEGQVVGLSRLTDLAQLQNLNYAGRRQERNILRFSAVAAMCVHNPDGSPVKIQAETHPNSNRLC
jgi:hypothetical protein